MTLNVHVKVYNIFTSNSKFSGKLDTYVLEIKALTLVLPRGVGGYVP